MYAASNGHGGAVGALLEHGGVELDAADNSGLTALMWAALKGQAAVAAQLVEAGADATLRTTGGGPLGGKTALGIAEANREFEVAAVLRRNRPQPEPEPEPGSTALAEGCHFPPEYFDRVLLDPSCSALGLRPRLLHTNTSVKELQGYVSRTCSNVNVLWKCQCRSLLSRCGVDRRSCSGCCCAGR